MRRSTRCRRSEKMRGDSLAPVEVKAARGTALRIPPENTSGGQSQTSL